jgi:CelD/BcsL family acetyltransferase involved in cellulose biosynthesis
MEYYLSTNKVPTIFVLRLRGKIVGLAPLLLGSKFGVRSGKVLCEPSLSPDIVIEPASREIFVEEMLEHLLNRTGVQYLDLILPSSSPNLRAIQTQCENDGRPLQALPVDGHTTLSLPPSWQDYARQRGKNFKKHLNSINGKLDRAGSWNVVRSILSQEAIESINLVEKKSWKENWRDKAHSNDPELSAILKSSQEATYLDKNFEVLVWLLELNNERIAYNIVLFYKDTAFAAKTSYDNRFSKMSPGIFLGNIMIKEIIESKRAKRIDFLTDLSYQGKWSNEIASRSRILISEKGAASAILPIFSSFVYLLGRNNQTRRIQKTILHSL